MLKHTILIFHTISYIFISLDGLSGITTIHLESDWKFFISLLFNSPESLRIKVPYATADKKKHTSGLENICYR